MVEDASSPKVVGDRGFVIRSFSARLGGVLRASPSFSVRSYLGLIGVRLIVAMPTGLLTTDYTDY